MSFITIPTRDSNWIAVQALTRVGKASVDNPPQAEDLALAIDRLDVVAANLAGRGIVYIADLDSVPSGLAHEVANALALSIQPDFGDMTPPGQGPLPPQAVTDMNLKRITSADVSYGPAQVRFW
jgi:hypothetical protein